MKSGYWKEPVKEGWMLVLMGPKLDQHVLIYIGSVCRQVANESTHR